jgi:choline dehydrogenase-like flavoprotein
MTTSFKESYDAICIGSGIGASTFAYGLAKRGLDVALLERGDFFKPQVKDMEPLHIYRFENEKVIGGQSKAYGAAMYRFRETDFKATEMEAGLSPAWPISYGDLEPYYCEAEKMFKIHGSSENEKTDPPRSQPWPYAPIPHQGPVVELVSRLEQRAGQKVSYIPRAIDYDPQGGGKCVLCRHCDGYYCPRDAKLDAEIAMVRPAIATGKVTVFTKTNAKKVLVTPDGKKVTGVLVERDGQEMTLLTSVVGLGCGLRETPMLLWRSRTSQHPKGLANGSGALGRYWASHTQRWVFPLKLGVQKKEFHQKTFAINDFYSEGVIQSAGNLEPLGMSRRIRWFANWILDNSFQVFAMSEALPTRDTGYELTDDGVKLIGMPKRNTQTIKKLRKRAASIFRKAGYVVFCPPMEGNFHNVGTARMGADPSESIVDGFTKAHDVDGLHVVDSCVLPTSGVLNSGLTIAAVALRAAQHARVS